MTIHIQGEIHSSKNSRQIFRAGNGRPFVAKSKVSKEDEIMLADQLEVQRNIWDGMKKGQTYPLFVVFHFIRKTARRWDFANLIQGVADAMVKAEYIPDDDVDHFIPVWGGCSIDKTAPGVDIWIERK